MFIVMSWKSEEKYFYFHSEKGYCMHSFHNEYPQLVAVGGIVDKMLDCGLDASSNSCRAIRFTFGINTPGKDENLNPHYQL